MDNIQPTAGNTASLTPREKEIYDMLLDGKTPKEIAYELNIAYSTVASHQNSIYRKLGIQSINELFVKFRPAGQPPTDRGFSRRNGRVIALAMHAWRVMRKKAIVVSLAIIVFAVTLFAVTSQLAKTDKTKLRAFMTQNDNNRRIFTELGWDWKDSSTWTSRGRFEKWDWINGGEWIHIGKLELNPAINSYIAVDWTQDKKKIKGIYLSGLGLTGTLDLSGFKYLETIRVANNRLTSLNISGCDNLRELYCYYNQLTSLDLSDCVGLQELICSNNQLTRLDLSGLTSLTSLYYYENQITNINLPQAPALKHINSRNNKLSSLDLSGLTEVVFLDVGGNMLTRLDVSDLSPLHTFYCWSNELTELDLSRNTALSILDCSSNPLTNLNFSNNTALTFLNCWNNQLESVPPIQDFPRLFYVGLQHNNIDLSNDDERNSLVKISRTIESNMLVLPPEWQSQAAESPEAWESLFSKPYDGIYRESYWDWITIIGGLAYRPQK